MSVSWDHQDDAVEVKRQAVIVSVARLHRNNCHQSVKRFSVAVRALCYALVNQSRFQKRSVSQI